MTLKRSAAKHLVFPLAIGLMALAPSARTERISDLATASQAFISRRDRVYAAEQFSNTVSVTDPTDNRVLGFIRLGDPQPGNLSPLYRGQSLVHGLGLSPDGKTLAVVSIGSNAVSFIDTTTHRVRHTTYLGRAPHEATFTPDGRELWVTVRGEDYIAIIDSLTYTQKSKILVPAGPGMVAFSPDGRLAYVCSSFSSELVILSVAERKRLGQVTQPSAFCPNIAATPDGRQVWLTLKDVGKVMVFNAHPPFDVLKVLDTGPITNHVNFARTAKGLFAYVTVGGLNQVLVFDGRTFQRVDAIEVGAMPHGLWPSVDGKRLYVGLENDNGLAVIDTSENRLVTTLSIGQAPQAVVYGTQTLSLDEAAAPRDLGLVGPSVAAQGLKLELGEPGSSRVATQVSLFDQGLTQILQAAVTGLKPKTAYVLALSERPNGLGTRQALSGFKTNPSGAAIVNAVGPIRQVVRPERAASPLYLVILEGDPTQMGAVVQTQILSLE